MAIANVGSKEVENMVGEQESGVRKPVHAQKVLVKVDMNDEQVLQFNQDKEVELVWSEDGFRELSETVEKQLSFENLKRYFAMQYVVKERAKKAAGSFKVLEDPMNPLGMNADFRLKIRERPGYHQCWKSPGQEFDAAMAGPYTQVHKQADLANGKKENKPAGEENGEVLKLIDGNGKVELIAVECKLELFEQFKEFMAAKSRQMYRGNKETFTSSIETLNRATSKQNRLKVIDEEGDVG